MSAVNHKDRTPREVKRMFSRIALRYDLLNHLLSLGLDFGWRKKVSEQTARTECRRILDVCTGTGDMAISLCHYWKEKAHIDAIDFSPELLAIGEMKTKKAGVQDCITFREANAEQIPFSDESFDAVTIAFGLRNIQDRKGALVDFLRVTKPKGCFVCLEFSQPGNRLFSSVYSFYLTRFVPAVSAIFGSDPGAYRYLGETIKDFPTAKQLSRMIEAAGWRNVSYETLAGGIVAIHRAEK